VREFARLNPASANLATPIVSEGELNSALAQKSREFQQGGGDLYI